jgi:hypothetical protein
MEAGEVTGATRSEPARGGYPGTSVAAALFSSLFFPLIALIASLFLMGSQPDPRKRADLVAWAWVSVTLVALQVVAAFFIFFGSSSNSASLPVQLPTHVSVKDACPDGLPDDGTAGVALKPGEYVALCNWSGKQTIAPPP